MVSRQIVINTGPVIALVAGLGSLDLLQNLFNRIIVPREVCEEVETGGSENFAREEFQSADFLEKVENQIEIPPYLSNALDKGESAVIQTALEYQIETVCIDELAGRRIARLNNLRTTGSIGICLLAQEMGFNISMSKIINNMEKHSIYLSQEIKEYALNR